MSKQLNVSLNFSANTEEAKRKLQELQTSLSSLINSTTLTKGLDLKTALKMDEAITSAAELKSHLQAATNVQTGNLDFSKLNESLRRSGKSLIDYGQQLKQLGPEGYKAFQSLASSVANAEMPLRRSNAMLNEMWVSLKNTARWQISSSILHGFMGTIQSAYSYAEDLNKSLNNIRIVTGKSVDEMAKFAQVANKAARELSTTTTEYTDAALIFYQQGLDSEEVNKRTEITVKMANAAGQSVQTVSDQLTAVWNNFDDGTKSLEYYADVMTALGAATASSTDEISGGLEKFAAIGQTIGLSYEYAASALATITSNTRQSEEVVGTALKTIFARIQGLKLGETLEDGTELNKYSEALQKVGISIYDAGGELKAMDNILDEMAAKWDTLSKAEQAALAQTVAGVRQYTQLIALMENWDNGDNDSMMANLNTSYNATGALQEQADIYAESWEAARDRVTAAAEAIYGDLLKDDVFIGLLNSLEKILLFIDKIIDNIGGLGGVLTTLGTIITRVFHEKMVVGLQNAAYSLQMLSSSGRDKQKKAQAEFIEDAANSTKHPDFETTEDKAQSAALKENLKLQSQLLEGAERMTEQEINTNKALIERARILGEERVKAAQVLDQKQDKSKNVAFEARTQVISHTEQEGGTPEQVKKTTTEFLNLEKKLSKGINIKTNLPSELKKMTKEGRRSTTILKQIAKRTKELGNADLDEFVNSLEASDVKGEDLEQTLAQIIAKINGINQTNVDAMKGLGVDEKTADEMVTTITDATVAQNTFTEATENSERATQLASDTMDKAKGKTLGWADHMVNAANMAMGLASAIQAVSSIVDTIQNPDMSGWEKFSSILMSLTMIVPMLTMAFNKESIASLAAMSAAIAHALGLGTEATAAMGAAAATGTFSGSLWTLLWPIGLVMLAIGALVAIVAGLISVFKMLEAASPAGQLKAAKENAAAAAEALEEANTAAQELKTTIEGYDSAVEKLKTVATNTEEFTTTLEEANAEARKLIDTYDLLAGKDYTFNADTGLIEFNDGVLEGLQDKADQRVTNASINDMAAKNQVLAAENAVEFEKMSLNEDDGYFNKIGVQTLERAAQSTLITFATGVIDPITLATAALAGATVGAIEGLVYAIGEDSKSSDQEEVLSKLNDLYVAHNNNFVAAYNALSDADRELIDALGYTDAELQGLIAATAENTKAIYETNKQIIDKKFEDNAMYNSSANKEYLNEILAEDLKAETERVMQSYKDDGTSGWESTDSIDDNQNTDKVKKYAEEVLGLQGYGITEFTGTRIDTGAVKITTAEGEELELSANQIMSYAAEQEALDNLNGSMGEYSKAANRLKVEEAKLADQFKEGKITYDEYVEALNKAMDAEIKAGTLTQNQVTSYMTKHGENQKGVSANAVKTALQDKGFISDDIQNFEKQFLDIYNEYSDKEIALAVQVANDATSLQDFLWDFERAVGQATMDGLKSSQDEINDILASGIANGEILESNLDLLASNDNFKAYLEEKNILLEDFSNKSYEQQVQLLTEYRGYLQELREEAIETQKVLVSSSLAVTTEEALNANDIVKDEELTDDEKEGMTKEQIDLYEKAIELRGKYAEALKVIENDNSSEGDIEKAKQQIAELEKEWEDKIGDGLPLSIDASDMGAAWDSIIALEEELLALNDIDVKIEFATDMVESLEDMIKAQSEFEKAVNDDMKKVNGNYQMTIDTARKWREIYPDLFNQAKVTGDGLIAINAAVVDNQLAGSDAIRAASAKQAIDAINEDIEELKAKKKTVEASLELARKMKEGEYNLEQMSAEDLALLRKSQTEFFMELGYDEQVATQMALKTMGITQQDYAKLVAEASVKSANKTIEANEEVGTRVQLIIANLKALWQGLLTGLKGGWDALVKWIKGEGSISAIGTAISNSWSSAMDTVNKNNAAHKKQLESDLGFERETITVNGEKYEITAEMKVGAHSNYEEALQGELDLINDTIADLEWSKIEIESLSKISGEDWGEDLDSYLDDDKDKKDKDNKDLLKLADRYHEITRELEAMEHQLELVGKAKDRAFGEAKLQAIEQEIEILEKRIQKQNELYKAQQVFLALDKLEVQSVFSGADFNEDGEISNYSSLVKQSASQLNAARTRYNNSGQTDADKEKLEAAEKKYEDEIAVLEQYEETLNETRASELAAQEAFDALQSAHAEKLTYNLELKMLLNDDELKQLDYYLKKTEDDMYQRAEGLVAINQQVDIHGRKMKDYKDQVTDLDTALKNGDISQAQYIEKMTDVTDGLYDELEALQELDDKMLEYYGETLAMAREEIEKVTKQIDHHNSVLDHYLTLLDLMNKSADYKTIGVVLEGQAEVSKNAMIASKKEYEMFQKETDAKYLAWKSETDAAAAEMLKKQYEDALEISSEAQEEYLSKAEDYGNTLKLILENSLNEYAQDLENALTGGTSFDQMNTKFERAAAIQEEYLTTTNKIYETNKMINTAQQEIDKTANTVAKQRLKQFINETNQLQKKNKLSQYELSIQQAKYDLLLAEIALEEAQNAKSSVRLQRDSEGNFGYVYTADQDKIANAQQQLADAQNSLYNISLEGQNDYFTKYQETMSEMYDYFTELHERYLSGEFESEQEYQNAVMEAKQYYYDLLEQYSDLYTIAISADARALEDAWSSEFNSMVYNTKNWQVSVDTYISKSQQSFKKYAQEIDVLAGEVGISGSYNEMANSVENVVDQSDALLASLLSPGGVFDTLEAEIALVNDVAAAYATERASVLELIKTYEALTLAITNAKRAEAGKEPLQSLDLPTNNAEQTTAVEGSAKPGDGSPRVGDKVRYDSGSYYYSSDGLRPTGSKYRGSEVFLTSINTASWATHPYHISTGSKLGRGDLGWLRLDQISGYDTGGYTGRWGSYGKLAMLHEKEIVLNKQDTENFLQSMELLDSIVKTIDLYSTNQQISGLLNSPSFGKLDSGTLEQMVTIDAHFPNVSSRVEIEEAFSTLVNRASQYVNRN